MQRIGFIVLPGFQMMSVAALSVFEFANSEIGEPVYDVHLLSETGGSIRSSIGISVATEPFDDSEFRHADRRRQRRGRAVDAGRDQISAPGFGAIAGESPRPAPARSSWPKQVCSTAVARPRTGTARANCRLGFQR